MMTAYPVPTFGQDIYVRATDGELCGPYSTAKEAVLSHLNELPKPVRDEIRKHVCRRRYYITHWYGDGAIRLAQGEGDNDLYVFVRSDGTVCKPRTRASQRHVNAIRFGGQANL